VEAEAPTVEDEAPTVEAKASVGALLDRAGGPGGGGRGGGGWGGAGLGVVEEWVLLDQASKRRSEDWRRTGRSSQDGGRGVRVSVRQAGARVGSGGGGHVGRGGADLSRVRERERGKTRCIFLDKTITSVGHL
jgi:hypothetical protein